jgi:hypothetical protein
MVLIIIAVSPFAFCYICKDFCGNQDPVWKDELYGMRKVKEARRKEREARRKERAKVVVGPREVEISEVKVRRLTWLGE